MHVLVTGAAGFVGAHVAQRLAREGHRVIGCDNFNTYYDPTLKRARVAAMLAPVDVACETLDLSEPGDFDALLSRHPVDVVIHLAAQAGVRHSAHAPLDYVRDNLVGFSHVLEGCRQHDVGHLVYASSSSVYGARHAVPFSENERVDAPVSFYAATKAANELLANAYVVQHGLRCTGLRLFSVYGPWGRPDMAYWQFARRILDGEPVTLFDGGCLQRDFTFIDDASTAIARLASRAAAGPHVVFNVGHNEPIEVRDFLQRLERALGRNARVEYKPAPPSEVPITCADERQLLAQIGPWPHTSLDQGLTRFARWYEEWRASQSSRAPVRDEVALA